MKQIRYIIGSILLGATVIIAVLGLLFLVAFGAMWLQSLDMNNTIGLVLMLLILIVACYGIGNWIMKDLN